MRDSEQDWPGGRGVALRERLHVGITLKSLPAGESEKEAAVHSLRVRCDVCASTPLHPIGATTFPDRNGVMLKFG